MAAESLVGRARETARIDALLDSSDGGAALLVRGEPGIGKSTLLRYAVGRARDAGFLTLEMTGVQTESDLPYSGLHQLLRPVMREAAVLPHRQAQAIFAAFGLADEAVSDRFLIALATLELLAEISHRQPLLVVADDAHWLDLATADVAAFVTRRLEADRIILIAAVRTGFDSPLAAIELPTLDLRGLDDEASRALIASRAPGVAGHVESTLLAVAQGNPLALSELPAALSAEHLEGVTPLPAVLPITERLERSFASRMSQLPLPTRRALLIAAIDARPDVAEVLAAATAGAGGTPVTIDDLSPAVDAGLVRFDHQSLDFRHPLIRSAIHQAATMALRRAAHAAFASVLADDPDRQSWHRASAIVGRDEEVASALDDSAARALRRGALASAAAALERAAELSDAPDDRMRRALQACELSFELGRHGNVRRLLVSIDEQTLDPAREARLLWLKEMVDPQIQTHMERFRRLVDLAERAQADGDGAAALNIVWLAAQRTQWRDPGAGERARIAAAARRLSGAGNTIQVAATIAYADPLNNADTLTDALAGRTMDLDPVEAQMAGTAAVITGAFDLAGELLDTAAAGLRSQGRLGHLARVLMLQGWCATYVGDWTLATTAADEARRFGIETGQLVWAAGAGIVEAIVAAVRGDVERGERLAAEAERSVLPFHASFMLAGIQRARGTCALSDGRPGDALDHLRRILDPADPAFHSVIRVWAIGDLAEAGAQSGRIDEAAGLVADIEPIASGSSSPWTRMALKHAKALLADPADAPQRYEAAIEEAGRRWPMDRARLLLAYGSWLRRQRRIAEARVPLRSARDAFDALGATAWGRRARQELRASGEASRGASIASWQRLSAQELQIARLAAEGLTNHEIGQKVFLSHRTVGSHLYRVFPKLGITSRNQLRAALERLDDTTLPSASYEPAGGSAAEDDS